MSFLTRILNEAEEVAISDLARTDAHTIDKLERILGAKAEYAWAGIHGEVVQFSSKTVSMNRRFHAATLKKLMQVKGFRWVEGDRESITVGL